MRLHGAMPRDGATTFSDLVGQLEEFRVEREKCRCARQYRLDRLIAEHRQAERARAGFAAAGAGQHPGR